MGPNELSLYPTFQILIRNMYSFVALMNDVTVSKTLSKKLEDIRKYFQLFQHRRDPQVKINRLRISRKLKKKKKMKRNSCLKYIFLKCFSYDE